MRNKMLLCACSLMAIGAQYPALAQGATTPASADTADTGGLQDIVVTAQKRSENLQDVPIAVSALTAQKLADTHALTTQDLQFSVPALNYTSLAGYAMPFLRGIGNDITQPNSDPSVATYIDGAFVSTNQATIQNLLGVQRIEVLEGPQGTLYGRNAVGGAINVITLTPSQDLEGKFTASLGNYNRREGTAYLSGGLTDKLSVGLYGGVIQSDSYIHRFPDVVLPGEYKKELSWGLRGKAVFQATDTVKFTASVEHTRFESFDANALREVQPNAIGYAFGAPAIFQRYLITRDAPVYATTTQTSATLRTDIDLDFANLLGISNYRNVTNYSQDDIDATTADVYYSTANPIRSKQYSQELQLLSPSGSKIQWIAGLYYFHEYGGFDPNPARGAVFAPLGGTDTYGLVKTNSYAGFGQATVPLGFITEKMRLTVGARYTIDRKAYNGRQDFIAPDGSMALPEVVYPNDHHTWKKFTPKVTLDYRIDQTLLYATYSKGYKAGVYNIAAPTDVGPVNPETLTSYEAGVKSDLLDHRLRINLAGYYYDFKNLQVQVVDPNLGGSTVLRNAANAEAYGVEANVTAALSHDLTLNGAVAWEHTKYKEFLNFPSNMPTAVGNATDVVDATGNQLQRAPKWVITLAADYTHTFDNRSAIHASVNFYHNGGFYWEAANRFRQDAYSLVNASMGYKLPGGKIDVSIWATNLTNTYYNTTYLPLPFGNVVQDAPPRMFGGTLSFTL